MTPTQRTLAYLRKQGFSAQVVERVVPVINVRRDLFGIGDIVAARARDGALLVVQCTSGTNFSGRIAKAIARGDTKQKQSDHAGRVALVCALARLHDEDGASGVFVLAWRKVGKKWSARRALLVVAGEDTPNPKIGVVECEDASS